MTGGLQVMGIMAEIPSVVPGSNQGKFLEFSGYMSK